MTGLAVHELHVVVGGIAVLNDVSLDVGPGEILALFGRAGAGKSALLHAISGLVPCASGQVLVSGRNVSAAPPQQRDIGLASQTLDLSPHLTARAHLASPLRARRMRRPEIAQRVAGAAALLRIADALDQFPAQLSRAQQQRVALARALVAEPKVLLLDDPLRHFDSRQRYQMHLELPRLLRRTGAAIVFATPDCREAMAFGDRVAVLIDGSVAQEDVPEMVLDAPATMEIARQFGDPPANLLAGRVCSDGAVEVLGVRFPYGAGECVVGVQPQDVAVVSSPHPRGTPVELIAVTPQRERLLLLLRTDTGEELLASVTGSAPRVGAALWAIADPSRALLYDAASGLRVPLQQVPAATEVAA